MFTSAFASACLINENWCRETVVFCIIRNFIVKNLSSYMYSFFFFFLPLNNVSIEIYLFLLVSQFSLFHVSIKLILSIQTFRTFVVWFEVEHPTASIIMHGPHSKVSKIKNINGKFYLKFYISVKSHFKKILIPRHFWKKVLCSSSS